MIQAGNGPRFALEPLAQVGLVREVRMQHFDGDDAVEARVACTIHLAHPARADSRENLIRPQSPPGLDRHGPSFVVFGGGSIAHGPRRQPDLPSPRPLAGRYDSGRSLSITAATSAGMSGR